MLSGMKKLARNHANWLKVKYEHVFFMIFGTPFECVNIYALVQIKELENYPRRIKG